MSCGKIIGGAAGYAMRCGGLWMGDIAKCDNCQQKELKEEKLRLQIKLLKKKINNL